MQDICFFVSLTRTDHFVHMLRLRLKPRGLGVKALIG